MVVAGYEEALRANSLDSLDALFDFTGGESLHKPGLSPWRERLRLSLDVNGKRQTFYLKRFTHPPARARRETRRSGSGASSTAGVEWTWMHRLAADGIPCAKPVAFGEVCAANREVRSAVLTEGVPGDSLERWVVRWLGRGGDGRIDRRELCSKGEHHAECLSLVEPLASLIARLHDRGYVHRDLYLSHIFYNPEVPVPSSLCLIDLQRVLRPRRCRGRWIVKDLASLDYSTPRELIGRTDRLRWLLRYLGIPGMDASARRFVYRIAGKIRRIARHERRRQARLRNQGSDT